MDRAQIADLMLPKLWAEVERLHGDFTQRDRINAAVIDHLLPEDVTRGIFERFPTTEKMLVRRSIRESKFATAQMDRCDRLVEEAVFAFQDPRVVEVIAAITGLRDIEPDTNLYAGGVSLMRHRGYLKPHLDNSHDGAQRRYRVLNLLFYVTPGWREEDGGSFQLWDNGPLTEPRTIPALFNRLVIMATNRRSWHSVNEIRHPTLPRCCVSNYYFSSRSPEEDDYFHATSFRDERASVGDAIMQADNMVRTGILKALPSLYKNPHVYRR